MAGAMFFHSTTHYDTDNNADFILFMDDVGRFKSWQASAGVGYIYNWVPAKGLLISGMAIPMATFYSHHKIWRFDSNLKDVVKSGGLDDLYNMDEADFRIWESKQNGVESMNSSLKWNIDARLSITYEWNNRLFFNAYGQFSKFKFKTDDFNGRLNDWYINTSMGIRL